MKRVLIYTTMLWISFSSQAWAQESIAAQEKTIPGGTLAMIAYILLWFLLLGYFVLLTTRLQSIKKGIKDLDARIDDLFKNEVPK